MVPSQRASFTVLKNTPMPMDLYPVEKKISILEHFNKVRSAVER